MQEVKICLQNFQSHRSTIFTLTPGLQVIWAKGNNVGKSSIFRALECLVRVQRYKGQKIKSLIRWGTDVAKIICEYNGMTTELRLFRRNTTAGYLFVHTEDGFRTEMESAPKCLLDALDILYDQDVDHVLNVLEADKVQLIVDETTITDSIMSTIFFDSTVDTVKENSNRLMGILNEDYNFYCYKKTLAEENIGHKEYNTNVDSFRDEKDFLFRLATALEIVPNYSFLDNKSDTDLTNLQSIHTSLVALENILALLKKVHEGKVCIDIAMFHKYLDICVCLQRVLDNANGLEKADIPQKLPDVLRNMVMLCSTLSRLDSLREEESNLTEELSHIQEKLDKAGRIVICPVKGRVVYSNEKCLPYSE